jgi:PAS domain S-box-containing protein
MLAPKSSKKPMKSEGEIRADIERIGAIFTSGTLGWALVSADGRLVEANPAVSDMTGYSDSELSGRPFHRPLPSRRP